MASESRKSLKANPVIAAGVKRRKHQTLKKYKQVHSIGSRKLRDKFVSYNDTYPMYESVVKAYLESAKDTLPCKKEKKLKRKLEECEEPNNNVLDKITQVDKKETKKEKSEKKVKVDKDKTMSTSKDSKPSVDKGVKCKKKNALDLVKKVCKATSKKNTSKEKSKQNTRTVKSDINVYQFMRLKREASLNASARVNIMFEKLPSPPKKVKLNHEDEPCKKKDKTEEIEKIPQTKCNSLKDKNFKEKSCKDKVEDVRKQRDEIIQKRKVKIEEKKRNAKIEKSEKAKTKSSSLKEKSLKHLKKLIPKCKTKTKCKDKDKKSNVKKKDKDKKENHKKKMKDKVGTVSKTGKRIASLNAQALMAASKEIRPSMERAARIDRFCVSWKRVSITNRPPHPAARWVEGLGNTVCCTTQASVCISKKEQQICEESKTTTTTTVMTSIQKPSPIHESELITDDRPSSVVDVVGAHTPVKPLSRTPQCIGTMFPSGQNCVPSCNGFSCGAGTERFVAAGQYQSLTLGGIGSLSSIQMMSYNQPPPPYRSAFTVPYNHASIPHYGYYGGGYYQPSAPLIHQGLHESCLLPHHVPVPVPHAQVKVLIHNPDSSHDCAFSPYKKPDMDISEDPVIINTASKKPKVDSKSKPDNNKPKKKVERRRSKSPKDDTTEMKSSGKPAQAIQREVSSPPHNWSWFGESEMKFVPTLNEGPPVKRKCYNSIQHSDGDIIYVRNCVLLRSGPRKKDIPFVAKVAALWENEEDGEMMMSLLWYYRPEHTEIGRKSHHVDCEVFASKHRDENSVACIDDKGYVLTFNEYCRYRAQVCLSEQHAQTRSKVVPLLDGENPLQDRMPSVDIDPSSVFVCRQVYDFRQKRMLKNPS